MRVFDLANCSRLESQLFSGTRVRSLVFLSNWHFSPEKFPSYKSVQSSLKIRHCFLLFHSDLFQFSKIFNSVSVHVFVCDWLNMCIFFQGRDNLTHIQATTSAKQRDMECIWSRSVCYHFRTRAETSSIWWAKFVSHDTWFHPLWYRYDCFSYYGNHRYSSTKIHAPIEKREGHDG